MLKIFTCYPDNAEHETSHTDKSIQTYSDHYFQVYNYYFMEV